MDWRERRKDSVRDIHNQRRMYSCQINGTFHISSVSQENVSPLLYSIGASSRGCFSLKECLYHKPQDTP